MEIRLSYITELQSDGMDGALKFVLPAATAPQLINDADIDVVAAGAGAAGSVDVSYVFDAEIHIEAQSTITAVECPSHGTESVAMQVRVQQWVCGRYRYPPSQA